MLRHWCRAGAVRKEFGLPNYLLQAWARVGCPALDGRLVRTKPDPEHVGYHLYFHADIRRALAAIKAPVEEFDADGAHWICFDLAVTRHSVHESTLRNWSTSGCPARGGLKIRLRKKLFASGGTKKLYERQFLDEAELKEAVANRPHRDSPRGAPNGWMTAAEVRNEFGLSKTFLNIWRRCRSSLLGGRQIANRIAQCTTVGRYGPMPYMGRVYRRADLEELTSNRRRQAGVKPDADWWSARVAMQRYGFHNATLHYWRVVSCIYLGNNQLLRARKERNIASDGRLGDFWLYYRPDLDLIARRKAVPADPVFRDDEGAWLPQRVAWERHRIYARTLIRWRTRSCRHLGGRKLNAKRVALWSVRNKHGLEWVYHEGDLRWILACRRGAADADGKVAPGTCNADLQATLLPSASVGAADVSAPEPLKTAGLNDPFAPYEPAGYFLKFDIAGDTLRQARLRGQLPAKSNMRKSRWFYSVPKARDLWWESFDVWEQRQRVRGSKP